MKNVGGILIEIALNLYIAFGDVTILMMLILPAQEGRMSSHFLASSSIFLQHTLVFIMEVCPLLG